MNISSTSFSSSMMQMQTMQRKEPPSASELSSKVFENSDSDADGLLSIDELGLNEESFSNIDTDGDGSLSSSELEQSISSSLEEMKDKTTDPKSFGEYLSSLGLEVPPPPPQKGMPNVSNMALEIIGSSDADEDGLLSLEELGIDKELFKSMDSDEDGKISQEELENKLTSLFEDLKNEDIEPNEFKETMNALGVSAPSENSSQSAGASGGQGGGGGGSSDEDYEEADTNQDGTVSAAEYMAYYGTNETDDLEQYTMDLVATLMDALKSESSDEETNIKLSQFKDIMKMVNNQIQDPNTAQELNTYLSNLD